MAFDLSTLSADDLIALKAKLDGLTDTSGRSPFRPRQLHDLRLTPTAEDPRPTFFWSAVPPRNAPDLTRTTLYPRLMWDATTGREITVADRTAEVTMTAKGFILTRPGNAEEPDLKTQIEAQLAQLSEADRAMLIEAAQQDRLAKVRELMKGLTQEELAALNTGMVPDSVEATARRRGRPRKDEGAAHA